MMTPTAQIQFQFEILFENGEKHRSEITNLQIGAYDAREYLRGHGINVSYTTILRCKAEKIYEVTSLPYSRAKNKNDAIAVFNAIYGQVNKVVDLHICVKRLR